MALWTEVLQQFAIKPCRLDDAAGMQISKYVHVCTETCEIMPLQWEDDVRI